MSVLRTELRCYATEVCAFNLLWHLSNPRVCILDSSFLNLNSAQVFKGKQILRQGSQDESASSSSWSWHHLLITYFCGSFLKGDNAIKDVILKMTFLEPQSTLCRNSPEHTLWWQCQRWQRWTNIKLSLNMFCCSLLSVFKALCGEVQAVRRNGSLEETRMKLRTVVISPRDLPFPEGSGSAGCVSWQCYKLCSKAPQSLENAVYFFHPR